eukprot:GFUD01006267.1.p1 GENE.GFUD01006267.1~~GFUD01006267.1.p1  ORF type:complete len:485 (-),score=98.81 GFUD01006267.1:202-1656(-)
MDTSLCLVSFLLFIVTFYFAGKKQRKLPPGLARLPLLGSLPWILKSGKHLMEIVKNDRKKYGDISSICVGRLNIVFLNEPQLIRDVMNMEECGGRAHLGLSIKSWGKPLGLVDPDIGPVWKEQKRFVLKCLRDQGFGKRSEASVQEEAKHLVSHILQQSTSGEDFLLKGVFNIPVINVIWKMVANKTFPLESVDGQRFVDLMEEIFGKQITSLVHFPLIGKWLAAKPLQRRTALWTELRESFMDSIEEHESTFDEQEPRDLIDNYLIEIKKGRPDFNKKQLVISIVDLFAAGSETSSSTLRWAILYLVLNPEVQEKCQEELDLLGSKTPALSDMDSLNFCQATILETLRLSCIAPGTLLHKALVDVKVAGYEIEKGTFLAGNFMSTHLDPEYWSEPLKFKPERFLDIEGKVLKEMPNFFPFSIGKRVCLGENLARVELFLFFTILVKNCQFSLPKDHSHPNESKYKIGITKIPDEFYCTVTDRN